MKKTKIGFTFVELLLYISVVSIMISSLVLFALTIINNGAKSSTHQEVFSQARYISERFKYEIRNATGINSVSSNSISLATSDSVTNPTVIDVLSGNIRLKQGAAAEVNLNSSSTTISNLIFVNYSSADNMTKHIQFRFTVNDNYASTRQEYISSITIESSAELRSN